MSSNDDTPEAAPRRPIDEQFADYLAQMSNPRVLTDEERAAEAEAARAVEAAERDAPPSE